MTGQLLKLYAKDSEDVQVVAAIVQDSIVPVSDMLYRPSLKNFVMVVQRFRWDSAGEGGIFERIRCALDIEGVVAVQRQGFDHAEQDRLLDLLTITLEDNTLIFVFAGGARLKLTLMHGYLRLEDFGEPWPTTHRPTHAT